jgi:hypothetical protein
LLLCWPKRHKKDVARIEAEGQGFWLINLFGERKFIEGTIQTINLMDGSFNPKKHCDDKEDGRKPSG